MRRCGGWKGWCGEWGCIVEPASLCLSSASLLSKENRVSLRWYRVGVLALRWRIVEVVVGVRERWGLLVLLKLNILQCSEHHIDSGAETVFGMLRLLIAYPYCTTSSTAASVLHVMCSFKASKISGITIQNAPR